MKYGKGTDLPGMPPSQGAQIGVIYVSPDDDRKTIVTAILAQDKLEKEQKREQIVLDLPQKNKAFQHPEDFDYLKTVRRRLRAKLIIVTPAGRGPGEFARQRQFVVFSTMESFVHSYLTDNTNQSDQSPPTGSRPNNKPDKRGSFSSMRKAAPTIASGTAGIASGGAARAGTARNASPQRRQPGPRPVSGLTPVGDMADLPTREQPIEPTPPQTPRPQFADEDEDRGFLSPSIVDADTVEQEHDEQHTNTPSGSATGSATFGAEWPAAADTPHTPSPSQGAGTGPDIESDDDWEALPPLPGQSAPAQVPNTPAAMSTDTASRKTPGRLSRTPTPIVLGAAPPMPPRTGKPTKVLPDPAGVGVAEPSSAPTPPPTTPNHNTGKTVAAGAMGAGAGVAAGGALRGTGTGKTPAAPSRPTPNTGKTPARNAGAAKPVTPAGGISAISAGWPPRVANRTNSPRGARTANRRKWPILLIALLILLTLFVVGALIVSANPGTVSGVGRTLGLGGTSAATVTITPLSKTEQDTYLLQGVNSDSNIANRQVGMRQLISTKSDTKQVTLTHVHQDAQAATGNITFLNFDTNNAQTVTKATVMFNLGNAQIALDQDIAIPRGTLVGTTVQAGKASVGAHAVQPGAAGNIGPLAINQSPCCGSTSLVAQNPGAFTGGSDLVDYSLLKQADVNTVTNTDQGPLKSSAQNDVTGQKKTNEQFLGDIHCDNPNVKSSVTPGVAVQVTTANITVSVACSGEAYDASAARTIAQNALTQKANQDPQLEPQPALADSTITTQVQPQTQPDGSTTFSVQASGLWYYNWTEANKQALLKKIVGMSKAQAQALLKGYKGVSNATITLNSGTSLPTDVNQIALKTNVPTGPSGGSNPTSTH